MNRFARVLAPVDFSDDSRASAAVAFALAATDGEVVVIHVDVRPDLSAVTRHAEVELPHTLRLLHEHQRARLAVELDQMVAAIHDGRADRVVRGAMVDGDPVDEICRYAADWPADLVVIGTHGESGSTRFLFGSVTAKVTRQSPCPVLVTRPGPAPLQVGEGFTDVLVGIDYSPFSAPITELAASMIAPGGRLTLVHVWQSPGNLSMSFSGERRKVAVDRLEQFAAALPIPTGVQIEAIVDAGGPAIRILAQAERMRSDLVVVGAHGRAGMLEDIVGTVADRVLRHAEAPVLLVPRTAINRG